MSERVLIAVEDGEAREALAAAARRCGLEPLRAGGEAEVAALLAGARPTIAIACARLLPAFGPARQARPVLLVTGGQALGDVLVALRAGALDYLPGPVADDALAAALERARELGAVREVRRIEAVEREEIERALGETGGNRVQAARRLGISVRTLFNRLKRYRSEEGVAA